MQVVLDSLAGGARRAEGAVVIIDVFRAFTTAAVAISRGATQILLTAEVEEALALRSRGIADIAVGEVVGVRPEGFDYGNSPYELSRTDVEGKTLAQRTSAGTLGVTLAANADVTYAGSLVTAKATARALLQDAPELVTIVAMGGDAVKRTDEDELCAMYIRNLMEGRSPDPGAVRSLAMAGDQAAKYHDPAQPHFHPQDLDWALRIDAFRLRNSREARGWAVGRAAPGRLNQNLGHTERIRCGSLPKRCGT